MMKLANKQILAISALAGLTFSTPMLADADSDLKVWAQNAGESLDNVMKYPVFAVRAGDEGVARYRVTIDRAGNVIKSKRTKSTNSRFLNGASRSTVRKADFPSIPEGYEGDTMTFAVQLNYQLADSYFEYVNLQREGKVTGSDIASNKGPLSASVQILRADAE